MYQMQYWELRSLGHIFMNVSLKHVLRSVLTCSKRSWRMHYCNMTSKHDGQHFKQNVFVVSYYIWFFGHFILYLHVLHDKELSANTWWSAVTNGTWIWLAVVLILEFQLSLVIYNILHTGRSFNCRISPISYSYKAII